MKNHNNEALKNFMLSLIDKDKEGKSIGNVALKAKFLKETGIEDTEKFWEIRNLLINDGIIETGRGKGGAVHRILDQDAEKRIFDKGVYKEKDLYEPFAKSIKQWGISQNYVDPLVYISAKKGVKRDTEKWSRPDITMVYSESYQFFPMSKRLYIITFEVKPLNLLSGGNWKEAVFETLSHSLSANNSYLAIHIPDELQEIFEETKGDYIKELCIEFGLGLIVFNDPNDVGTFETILEAKLKEPKLRNVEKFIKTFDKDFQEEIRNRV